MKRISLGLVSLVLSILLAARALDLVPDSNAVELQKRVALCEALAVECSISASRDDTAAIETFATFIAKRNPEVTSIGIRGSAGKLLVSVSDHNSHWNAETAAESTPTQMHAEVTRGRESWGKVEMTFAPLPYSGCWQWIGGPMVPLLAFTATVGFLAFTLCLHVALRRVDWQRVQVVPQRVRNTLDTLVEGVLVLDTDHRIKLANQGFAKATGRSTDELLGSSVSSLPWSMAQTDPATADAPWVRTLRDGTAHTGVLLTLDGPRKRKLSVNTTPILADDGTCRGALATFDDLTPAETRNTRLRKLLARLRRSRNKIRSQKTELQVAKDRADAASRAKGEFLANVSHEIRTPMNAIIGMTEVVLEGRLALEHRECLEIVTSAASSLLGVINDLLDLSKIESGKFDLDPTDFDLRTSLDDTLHALAVRAHKKRLQLICDMPSNVPTTLFGDPMRLRQIIINLVGNAIKFTERGEIVLRVSVGDRQPDKVDLQFSISDTGVGIAPNKLKAIFEPFVQADGSTTRKYGGTGLGLSISNHLVGLMGGGIWAESELGKGSTFHFTANFGLSSTTGLTPLSPILTVVRDLPVLIADANPTSRRVLSEMLESLNFKPCAVGTAGDALEHLERATDNAISLVLIDADLADDGFALAEYLQKKPEWSGAIVLMVSSADLARDAERCKTAGVTLTLRKPLKKGDLLRVIRQALEASSTSTEAVTSDAANEKSDRMPPLRILLADDNHFNQRVALSKLENWGHTVRIVDRGRDALAVLAEDEFDLLCLDVQMPDMDGFEVAAAVRRSEAGSGRRLPIIALTAHAMKGDRDRCLAAGMDGYVPKPIQDDEFRGEIARAVVFSSALGISDFPASSAADTGLEGHAHTLDATPILDPKTILARVGGNRDTLQELVDVFAQDSDNLLVNLENAVAACDGKAVRTAVHTLKGMVGFFGAKAAYETAKQLECEAENCHSDAVHRLVLTLIEEVFNLRFELHHYVGRLATV